MKWLSPRFLPCCLFLIGLLAGCNKQYTPVPNPAEQAIIHLTGNNGAYSLWRLHNLVIDNSLRPYADYSMTYNLNGSFKDSDGMKGTWTLVNKDSVSQKISNATSGVYAVQGYRIVNISATQLNLSYWVNNRPVSASYSAER